MPRMLRSAQLCLAQKLDRRRVSSCHRAARVDMVAGKFAEAKNKLAPVLAQADENGYLLYVFDARLALGELP